MRSRPGMPDARSPEPNHAHHEMGTRGPRVAARRHAGVRLHAVAGSGCGVVRRRAVGLPETGPAIDDLPVQRRVRGQLTASAESGLGRSGSWTRRDHDRPDIVRELKRRYLDRHRHRLRNALGGTLGRDLPHGRRLPGSKPGRRSGHGVEPDEQSRADRGSGPHARADGDRGTDARSIAPASAHTAPAGRDASAADAPPVEPIGPCTVTATTGRFVRRQPTEPIAERLGAPHVSRSDVLSVRGTSRAVGRGRVGVAERH